MSKEKGAISLTDDEIIEIIKLVEESDFDELHLETEGLKLTVGKGLTGLYDQGAGLSQTTQRQTFVREEPTPEKVSRTDSPTGAASSEPDTGKVEPEPPAVVEEEGLIPIEAPLLGTFYRSPKPGVPPFVDVGTSVTEDDTVCLIEVMKLFTTVKAGVKGRIAKICVENNQMVEYQQTLFFVEPEE